MISPGGLLLVVSYLFSNLSSSFMGGVGKKSEELNLDVRNILAGSHTKHRWSWPKQVQCTKD